MENSRIWASGILKEYLKKGFVMDDKRLKELGGGGYFKELLERIRDIRASEKVFMGLTSFEGTQPTLREAKVAKNYLDEKELRAMGQLVSGYLDFAEVSKIVEAGATTKPKNRSVRWTRNSIENNRSQAQKNSGFHCLRACRPIFSC